MVSTGNAFVDFRSVQKSYDGHSFVVKDLNLSIFQSEFLTMLGPSGSGKTTSLMMLAGFESVTSGEIVLAGRPLNKVPPEKRGIGMVFQNYALFPHMTVGENLAFPLEVRKMGKAEREAKIIRALEMVKLEKVRDRRPAQLSGGQQQRIALARALVFEPQLVLMDEPLGALDKQLREHMQFEITNLAKSLGITTVYVTHDQGEALTMSDRIAVFNDGRIQQLAPPSKLYEQPENGFIAQFIGENNTLSGVVKERRGDEVAVLLDSGVEIVSVAAVQVERGKPVIVSIRPERVEHRIDTLSERRQVLDARVLEIVYMGASLRVRLRVGGSDEFFMMVRNGSNAFNAPVGSDIKIGWEPSDARAFEQHK